MASIRIPVRDLNQRELQLHVTRGIELLAKYERQNGAHVYEFRGRDYTLGEFRFLKSGWSTRRMRRWLLTLFPNEYRRGTQGQGSKYGRRQNRGVE